MKHNIIEFSWNTARILSGKQKRCHPLLGDPSILPTPSIMLQDEKLAILRSQSASVDLSDDVSLEKIVGRILNFTGADIKALLYNAQLEAIHRATAEGLLSKTTQLRTQHETDCMSVTCADNQHTLTEEHKDRLFAKVQL